MYALKIWINPSTSEARIYISGTSRSGVYFNRSEKGGITWSSKANDTPRKFQSGDRYGKIRKDGDAAHAVAEAYNVTLAHEGDGSEWDRLMQIARDGIEVEG